MALLSLTGSLIAGSFLGTAGSAQAAVTGSPAAAAPAKTTSAVSAKPSPSEGHSPQVTQSLSGPLSGTGLPRAGSSASNSAASRSSAGALKISNAMEQATATGASTVLNGIDVSSAQHPNSLDSDINWPDVASAGYQFAGIKATEGNYYTNPFYASDAQNATAAGMYVTPYAFANPYDPSENGTAVQQADYAASNAAAAQDAANYTVGGQYLPLTLDLEPDPYASEDDTNSCYGLDTSDMVTWISSFLAEAQSDTGAEPIIYTTQSWWNTCTGDSTAFSGNVLWVAAYSAGTPGTLPSGWNTWNLWQYSSAGTVSGISGDVDLDYFSGVPETLQTAVDTAVTPVQARTLSALAGDSETYTATGLPPGTSISASGQISGTPTAAGTYNVTVTPSGSGTVVPATMSFTWDVAGTITVTAPANQSTTAGSAVNLQVAATDATSGYTPSFSATGLPPGLSISSSGEITGWPDTPGTYSTVVTAADSTGASASASFTWTVAEAGDSGATGTIVLSNGGKCLDDTGSSTADGNLIQIWTCNGDDAQKWTVAPDGTIRAFGMCLDVTNGGTANGTPIQLWGCIAGDANQRWEVGSDAQLINPQSGKCLDDTGQSTANGTKLEIYTCNGGTNQRWTLPAGAIASGIAGKCMDDTNYSTSDGNKIQVYSCNGGAAQNWTVEPDGTVRVYGMCLDVTGHGTTSGTDIQLFSCESGDTAQQWQLTATSDLSDELVNPASGLCLGDPGDSTVNGTQLEIVSCSSTDPGVSWNVR
jgi:GH25 family lysozyme M1 (1,4-beta-N-acetylmuramidase)